MVIRVLPAEPTPFKVSWSKLACVLISIKIINPRSVLTGKLKEIMAVSQRESQITSFTVIYMIIEKL